MSTKTNDYSRQAKELWGTTPEYREYEKKSRNRTPEDEKAIGKGLMDLIATFGKMQNLSAEDPKVQGQVDALQSYLSSYYYNCSDSTLLELGNLYVAGGEMTDNIEAAGGKGTAAFLFKAIQYKVNR